MHSRALRISRMQNIDFPELDGQAMMAVNGCINLRSIVSKFIVGNLAREVDIVSSNSSLVYKPSSGSGFGWRLGNPSPNWLGSTEDLMDTTVFLATP